MCRSKRFSIYGIFFATFCLCGCGDPARDRLAAGQRVILTRDEASPSAGGPTYDFVIFTPLGTENFTTADLGTEAVVVGDEGKAGDGYRPVTVRVREGKNRDTTGTVSRHNLRLVK
jgi:hypothetical protein